MKLTLHSRKFEDLIIITEQKYNNGEDVKIVINKEVTKTTETAVLGVNNEDLRGNRNISKDSIVRLKKVSLYFGGVPPEFHLHLTNITENLTLQSLLGDMRECRGKQVYSLHESSTNQKKFDVEAESKEVSSIYIYVIAKNVTLNLNTCFKYNHFAMLQFQFRNVWLEGKGYVAVKIPRLGENFTIQFLINTNDSDSFVMAFGANFEINLVHSKVQLVGENGKVILTSKKPTKHDAFCQIELLKENNKVSLLIDGVEEIEAKWIEKNVMEETLLYIGRSPHKTRKFHALNGQIKDIFINGRWGFSTLIF